MLNKFSNLEFPIYALNSKPTSIEFRDDGIYVQKSETTKPKLLDLYLDINYFEKILKIESLSNTERLKFDFTVTNMQSLVYSIDNIKWGVDYKGRFLDFTSKIEVPKNCRRILKRRGNYIFLSSITYPFLIPPKSINISEADFSNIFVETVLVNGVWYIYKFVDFPRYREIKIWI